MAQDNSSTSGTAPVTSAATSAAILTVDLSKAAILVVDNQKAARQLLTAYLIRIGVGKVEEANDNIEALRILTASAKAKAPFRAVFVSRMMRDTGGLELVSSIRELPAWTDLPIVVVSEELDVRYVKDAVTVGASDYLIRPYGEESLRNMLVRLLGK